MDQVQYMEYIIDDPGMHVDPSNIQVINDYTSMKTLIELHRILGIFHFYHRFMLEFSYITWTFIQVSKGLEK